MRRILIAVTMLFCASSAMAQGKTLKVNKSKVVFVSKAPVETIKGVSKKARGSISIDATNLSSATGKIEVPVSTIDTGIKLRDEHLRSDTWLDATKFPNAVFEISSLEGASSLEVGKATALTIKGKFTLHGKTKPIKAKAKVKWDGKSVQGKAKFKIKLSDFGVNIPAVVKLKVSNEVTVSVSLRAS